MLQDNEGTISTQDQPTGSDVFVSVEMSRSKWVVGIHTPVVGKRFFFTNNHTLS